MNQQAEIREMAGRGDLSFLDQEALQEWVLGQRWFGAKGRTVSHLEEREVAARCLFANFSLRRHRLPPRAASPARTRRTRAARA